jgi:signal transduction histidine kinase
VHSGFAGEMLQSAIEQFVPALAVGVLLTVVLVRVAPGDFWLLPGLWSLIFSLGVFASCRFLPRQMFAVGVWYLVAGLFTLVVASGPKAFLPWTMGIPFGVGQLLVAAVLRLGFEDSLE